MKYTDIRSYKPEICGIFRALRSAKFVKNGLYNLISRLIFMLHGLIGNKNVQKILLFLFVNSKCYGAQLQRLLRTPLTSLQNAFARLEKGKVISSYFEGKTKVYQLNPSYPLLVELEQLLKKAYTLLPPQEKKLYSLVQQDAYEIRVQAPLLSGFWDRLKTVKELTLLAKTRSKEGCGWDGNGKGNVLVAAGNDGVLTFHERGSWQVQQNQELTFSNTFRWTLDRDAGLISLEHLRLGPNNPVFLFHLAPTGSHLLASVDSHLCEEDVYLAQVSWDRQHIRLSWRVIGPNKNEEMEYCYT